MIVALGVLTAALATLSATWTVTAGATADRTAGSGPFSRSGDAPFGPFYFFGGYGPFQRPRSKDPVVWAHRGASKNAPDETFAAYRRALADGTDVLEGDIAQTNDGQLVVIHDDTLARTTNVEEVFPDRAPWNIRDLTLAEIKQLDAGTWFDPTFAGEKVPTMREWIAFNSGRAGLAPDIKNPTVYPGIVDNVAAELRH